MKKIIFTLLALAAMIPFAQAQSPRFGATIGGTMGYYRTEVEGEKTTSGMTPGFSIGGIADIPVGEQFTFQPSLQFLQKGGKESQDYAGQTYTNTIHINYIEMPLNFLYKAPSAEGSFVFGLGPVLSYGVGGTDKISDGSTSQSESIKFGTDEAFQNAFEFSAQVVVGYQWESGFLVQANYNMGFSNLWGGYNATDNSSFKNSYIGLRVGYFFGGGK